MQEVRDDFLDAAPRKKLDQGLQARRIIERQTHRIFPRGERRRRIFPPAIEQGLEFHDYSAIPSARGTREARAWIRAIIALAPRLHAPQVAVAKGTMNFALSSEDRNRAMSAMVAVVLPQILVK
jgi:hypothetical protein